MDNDADQIFAGSVDFIRSVVSTAGAASASAAPVQEASHEQA
jgi:carboxylesterase